MVHDVDEAQFQSAVLDRSHEVPVVVDFWAEWCGPCRQLGPALEAEATKRGNQIDLAKVDVDSNQALSQRFGVQGIPAVKAFRDGAVVEEFTGALPPAQVATFFNGLVPSEADRLAASGEETDLRRALELDPRQLTAARKLAQILLGRDEHDEAISLLTAFEGDFEAVGIAARAKLSRAEPGPEPELTSAFEAWEADRPADALEALQEVVAAEDDRDRRDLLRQVMVAIFAEVGTGSDLAREHRRRLALALS